MIWNILLKLFAFNNNYPYLYICSMPIGIYIIIKMQTLFFFTADELSSRIDTYFNDVEGELNPKKKPGKESKGELSDAQKIWNRDPELPTISGLALFLGFDSLKAFEDYEKQGKFAPILKRGRLRIETVYEKKLHMQSPAGAIFALKNMGWNDKNEEKTNGADVFKTLKIEIIETGPYLAASENEVVL